MTRALPLLVGSAGLMLLAACTEGTRREFYSEAGSEVDAGDFGNASMNNVLAMTSPQDYVINLAQRFAREVPTRVTFAFNSAELDETAIIALQQQARWIRQFPEVRFRVYGHTDLVGSNDYNYNLGLRRAQAVVAYLSSQGIARSRLEALVSFGETRPVVQTENEERQNRRTVTEVSGFVQGSRSELDGKYAALIYGGYLGSAGSAPAVQQATGGGEGE